MDWWRRSSSSRPASPPSLLFGLSHHHHLPSPTLLSACLPSPPTHPPASLLPAFLPACGGVSGWMGVVVGETSLSVPLPFSLSPVSVVEFVPSPPPTLNPSLLFCPVPASLHSSMPLSIPLLPSLPTTTPIYIIYSIFLCVSG